MSHRAPALRALVPFLALAVCLGALSASAQPATKRPPAPAAAEGPTVPPLPEGTPEELLDFAASLRQPKVQPRTRDEMMAYMREMSAVSVQAADKVLAAVGAEDELHVRAAKLKLESLMMLGRLGDAQAATDMEAFAAELVNSPNAELATEAQRLMLMTEAQKVFQTGDMEAAPGLIDKMVALVKANPDDGETAMLSMQIASAFGQMPDGEELAVKAYTTLGPLFASSKVPQIQEMAKSFEGTLRRMSLPGNPLELKGTLMDGSPFDPASVEGKVVLVDFWATWCGPCVAEIPNMLEQYEKYHDKGFEIIGISLDQDRDALDSFVTDRKIPWPILHEKEGGGQHPLAEYYGINAIPQLILIGRDGNVITLNARGEKLAEELAQLFKDG